MIQITRKTAIQQNLPHYFTGKPCKRGHVSLRYTNTCNCVECGNVHAAKKRHADVEGHRAKKAAEYARNKETILEQQSRYRKANWESIYSKRKNDPEYQAYMVDYFANRYQMTEDSKAVLAANVRFRQAAKRRRTPSWLTKDERKLIAEVYKQARHLTKSTGIKHVVDHIIPLQGELVSGLHCLSNLQILTATENRQKSNSYVLF